MALTLTTIDLLRHGEVEGGSCYRGITDDPLSSNGWDQMHNKLPTQTHWDLIFSSPLTRCHAFAQFLSHELQLPLHISPSFQELDFGDWEGKTADQINPQLLDQFYLDPISFPPPNGERFAHFQQRVIQAWQSLYKVHQGKHILLITHAGVIRIILAHILAMDIQHSFRLKINNACLSNIQCFQQSGKENFFQLVRHG
ncbi:hypothetical protein AU255_17260 [Methyloprofundus sedimenti]|uniref:Alpha-ribazole phosphatase n=1 Tax=Methyloprofundus sedimenti TaxID=1420851 RepID=A0A1V8M2Z4_9GAMM|nr:alpha-ribazole phosphatase [Methyloprofundus sedimenti]OQK15929.1 hypothetical protein AU255_17260 [Methyloprofundus sedimenti]